MLENYFPRTIYVLENLMSEKLKRYLDGHSNQLWPDEIQKLISFVEGITAELPTSEQNVLIDVFRLEREKFKLDNSISTFTLLYVQQINGLKDNQTIINDDYLIGRTKLTLNPS